MTNNNNNFKLMTNNKYKNFFHRFSFSVLFGIFIYINIKLPTIILCDLFEVKPDYYLPIVAGVCAFLALMLNNNFHNKKIIFSQALIVAVSSVIICIIKHTANKDPKFHR